MSKFERFTGAGVALCVGGVLPSCHAATPSGAARADAQAAAAYAPEAGYLEAGASLALGDPPYDLAADVHTRIERARSEFGPQTPVHVEGDVFVMVAPDKSRLFEPAVALVHDALAALYNERFSAGPDRAVTVFAFGAQAPYDAYSAKHGGSKGDTLLGFYSMKNREIVANLGPGVSTLTHEIVHPIVQTDFPRAPAWLNEGLGALFEMPVLPRAGEIHGIKNWRLPRLLKALASPAERDQVRIENLFGMTDEAFRGPDQDLHYAIARYFCQWLDDRGALWPFYRSWRANIASDPTGRGSFKTVLGSDPEDLDAAWADWARHL